jgi:hypothetical protein
MWPFKRKPRVSMEEFAAQFPAPPCGQQTIHYEWVKVNSMACPACCVDRKRREKDAELDALADKIAARLRDDNGR